MAQHQATADPYGTDTYGDIVGGGRFAPHAVLALVYTPRSAQSLQPCNQAPKCQYSFSTLHPQLRRALFLFITTRDFDLVEFLHSLPLPILPTPSPSLAAGPVVTPAA